MTTSNRVYLAVDLGAGSGRVLAGVYDGSQIDLHEVHRFDNTPLDLPSGFHWNLPALYQHILDGLRKAADTYGGSIRSLGIDTWGVDYGLIDKNGRLLGLPHQYRDPRTNGMPELIREKVSGDEILHATGVQFAFFNTINQLMADQTTGNPALDAAEDLLFMPDLLGFLLTGERAQEQTIASTSQLYSTRTRGWDYGLIERLSLPARLFKPLRAPGTPLGKLRKTVQQATKLENLQVVSVAGHDTASAVAAVPSTDPIPAFLSSGTWSPMGLELPDPEISDKAFAEGFTNEAGVGNRVRFLKNICGLWLIQECRRSWKSEGRDIPYAGMATLAAEAEPFRSLINPDDPRFAEPGGMPGKIRELCRETGQPEPETPGQIIRCIYESLALRYAQAWDQMTAYADPAPTALHVVGGGCQDQRLNHFIANALGVPVITRPVEATGMGNVMIQMMADGELDSLEEGRKLVKVSASSETYQPEHREEWLEARKTFAKLGFE